MMSKEEYYKLITAIRTRLSTDECKECSCPKTNCEWHGNCYTCVRQHRMFGNHVPNCLQFILDEKVATNGRRIRLQGAQGEILYDEATSSISTKRFFEQKSEYLKIPVPSSYHPEDKDIIP